MGPDQVNGGIRNYRFIVWTYGPCSALGRWRLHLPCKCLNLLCFKLPARPWVLLLTCCCWHLISEVSSEDWLCFDWSQCCVQEILEAKPTQPLVNMRVLRLYETYWLLIEFAINLQRHTSPAVRGLQPLCLLVRASTPRFSPVFTPRAAFPLTGNWPITSFCLSSTNGAHKTDPGSEGGGM